MNRSCRAILTLAVLIALSAPAWAHGSSGPQKHNNFKESWHHWCQIIKDKWHENKVSKQYRELVEKYERTMEEAQLQFLEYLGTAPVPPSSCDDVEAIKAEYEQQIAQLNETIASDQQQIDQLNTTISSNQQQMAELNATIVSYQQQLADAEVSRQAALEALTSQLNQECSIQVDNAYQNGFAAGTESCVSDPGSGPAGAPQLLTSWSTGNFSPSAIDVDASGNAYVLDSNYLSVATFDATGNPVTQWSANSLSMPVDLALDPFGNVYVLDAYASAPLQKFSADGQPLSISQETNAIFFPMGLFIDSQGTIYVTDMGGLYGSRILVFDATGALIKTIGEVSELSWEEYHDVAVDEQNQVIYVVTSGNKVAKFDMTGNFLGAWAGSLKTPNSIALGAQGQIFVADTYNDEIDQYDQNGSLVASFGSSELYRPSRIVVKAGKLYLADDRNMLIRVYQ